MNVLVFEISTGDFNHAIHLCEIAFIEPHLFEEDWKRVKESQDFNELSLFLRTHDINNNVVRQ